MTVAPTILCDGTQVDINNPRPEDFNAPTIATHLSRIPRFLGATRRHYSVLEHSILGCEYVLDAKPFGAYTRIIARSFLFHDAHEVVIGDIVEPVSRSVPGIADLLRPVKARIDRAISERFGVHLAGDPFLEMIKEVDVAMLRAEWIDLMPTPWYGGETRLVPKPIDPHHPHAPLQQMIGQFMHLMKVTA